MGRAIIDPRRPVTEGGLQLKSSTGQKSWPPRSARFDSERIDTDKEMHPGSVIQDGFASAASQSWHQTARQPVAGSFGQRGHHRPSRSRPSREAVRSKANSTPMIEPNTHQLLRTRTTCSEPQQNGARESNPAGQPSPRRFSTIPSLPFLVGIETRSPL